MINANLSTWGPSTNNNSYEQQEQESQTLTNQKQPYNPMMNNSIQQQPYMMTPPINQYQQQTGNNNLPSNAMPQSNNKKFLKRRQPDYGDNSKNHSKTKPKYDNDEPTINDEDRVSVFDLMPKHLEHFSENNKRYNHSFDLIKLNESLIGIINGDIKNGESLENTIKYLISTLDEEDIDELFWNIIDNHIENVYKKNSLKTMFMVNVLDCIVNSIKQIPDKFRRSQEFSKRISVLNNTIFSKSAIMGCGYKTIKDSTSIYLKLKNRGKSIDTQSPTKDDGNNSDGEMMKSKLKIQEFKEYISAINMFTPFDYYDTPESYEISTVGRCNYLGKRDNAIIISLKKPIIVEVKSTSSGNYEFMQLERAIADIIIEKFCKVCNNQKFTTALKGISMTQPKITTYGYMCHLDEYKVVRYDKYKNMYTFINSFIILENKNKRNNEITIKCKGQIVDYKNFNTLERKLMFLVLSNEKYKDKKNKPDDDDKD